MRKLIVGGVVTALLLAGGIGAVWAVEDVTPTPPDAKTFEEMLPFMKKMHPDVTDETLKEVFNACHGDGAGGMMGKGMGWHQNMMRGL
ncbi:FAD/FMN-containing dehydrogenase [Ammoniphilus sp. 3BR4]|uniref:FAD/FMN-containing dehydrogenase n=1 Tax=Ammoniphilus sp. 3BR4 TaxID=3158265 RepID=UPI0034651BE8